MKNQHSVGRKGSDRISELADDILVRILSFLPTEDAVKTSFLSKRWKSLWTSVGILDLDFNRFSENSHISCSRSQQRRFVEFVERQLGLHEGRHLQKLRLVMDIYEFENYYTITRSWVSFAMISDCSSLDLDFSSGNEECIPNFLDHYTLPPCCFPHPSLSDLKLTKCEFIPSLYGRFHSVKKVVLVRVDLPKFALYDMLSKCECLEELHLTECKVPSFLEFNELESNLKCLSLESCFGIGESIFWVDINIPNLVRFKFSGTLCDHFSVSNSENLVEAELDLFIDDKHHMLLFDLLNDLQSVKSLTLSSRCLAVLSTKGGKVLPTSFCNLEHLILKQCPEDRELLSLRRLLRSAPSLENLSVEFVHDSEEDLDELIFSVSDLNEKTFWGSHLFPFNYVSNLKRVEIKGFLARRIEMEFVKAVLKNSIWLKKIVIFCKPRTRSRDALVMEEEETYLEWLHRKQGITIEDLLALPKASPNAQILLKQDI